MPKEILRVEDITICFGGLDALKDVSLSLNENELLSLVGPNGAGKTTLFNVISSFYKPTSGNVYFLDQNITGQPDYKVSRMGLVRTFQNLGIYDSLTVLESVCVAKYQGLLSRNIFNTVNNLLKPWKSAEKEAKEIIRFVNLEGNENAMCHNLPYGEQKKLEIARSLATKPKVLMLDEPAAGLNNEEKVEIRKVIRNVVDLGISVLLVEHDVKLVTDISDRVVVLNHGRVIEEGDPKTVMSSPQVVEAYIGKRDDNEIKYMS